MAFCYAKQWLRLKRKDRNCTFILGMSQFLFRLTPFESSHLGTPC